MENSKLIEKVEESFSNSKKDHLLSVLKATLEVVPMIGGALSSLMSDYIPTARETRLKEFLLTFAEEMSRVSDKVDTAYIQSDRFSEVFAKSLKTVSETHSKEKREFFKTFLLRAAINPTPDADVEAMFLSRLNEMTVSHIKVLGIFGYPHKNIQRQFDWQEERSSSAIVNRVVAENVLELSELSWHPGKRYLSRHVHAIIEDLVRWGFIDDPGNYDDKDHDDLGAEDVVDFINGFLTSFGRDFLNYMES